MGAGSAFSPDDVGGSGSLSHSGTAVGNHSAGTSGSGGTGATGGAGAHTHDDHTYNNQISGDVGPIDVLDGPTTHSDPGDHQHSGPSHVHSTPSLNHSVTQPGSHADSRPPYYALAYIMRI